MFIVRFFASIGPTILGPSTIEELLKTPAFDGDTLVCPVGSENSADWQPALSYPPLRTALLAPTPPASPPPPPTEPVACRLCAYPNPKNFRFCNECGASREEKAAPRVETTLEAFPEVVALPADPPATPSRKSPLKIILGAAVAGTAVAWWLFHARQTSLPPIHAPVAAPAPVAVATPVVAVSTSPAAATPVAALPTPLPPVAPAMPATATARPRKEREIPVPKSEVKKRKRRVAHAAKSPRVAPAKPAPPADSGFLLPGVPRRVPPHASAPPAVKEEASDDGTTKQVREQFQFCSQLLAQGAFADHFETCLCTEAKQAAPYRGRSSSYAAALKKAAAAHALPAGATVGKIIVDGSTADVAAKWTPEGATDERSLIEKWRLEAGLWCRTSAAFR